MAADHVHSSHKYRRRCCCSIKGGELIFYDLDDLTPLFFNKSYPNSFSSSLAISTLNTLHHSRLIVCLPDFLDFNLLSIYFVLDKGASIKDVLTQGLRGHHNGDIWGQGVKVNKDAPLNIDIIKL